MLYSSGSQPAARHECMLQSYVLNIIKKNYFVLQLVFTFI